MRFPRPEFPRSRQWILMGSCDHLAVGIVRSGPEFKGVWIAGLGCVGVGARGYFRPFCGPGCENGRFESELLPACILMMPWMNIREIWHTFNWRHHGLVREILRAFQPLELSLQLLAQGCTL
jgi:hypothetical protein